jgi:DtxR family Mn-dependent transcriptional regulator
MPDPIISLLAGLLILGIVLILFRPEQGLVSRWQRMRRMSLRVLSEDALKHIHSMESNHKPPTVESVAGALQISVNQAADLLTEMERRELVTWQSGRSFLTPEGSAYALQIIRSHRLWERYLAEETGYHEAEWHDLAERFEHLSSPEAVNLMASRLGHPRYDPHGDPIPTSDGQLVVQANKPLTVLELDHLARIIHIEDEPETVYAQLVAEGLYPGMLVRVMEKSPQRIRFWANGDEHILAPIVAANISIQPIIEVEPEFSADYEPLSSLKPGQLARVKELSPRIRGAERRRLMDLGLLPGTQIEAALVSPSGDPTAYRVRGALIALRKEQADLIDIIRNMEMVK